MVKIATCTVPQLHELDFRQSSRHDLNDPARHQMRHLAQQTTDRVL